MEFLLRNGAVMRSPFSLLFISSFAINLSAQAEVLNAPKHNQPKLARELPLIVDAKAIERVAPKYPISEARAGRDGWVRLSFIIEPDGQTSHPIVEESSGGVYFEKEALKAIKKWKYEPAKEEGQAIQQCNNSVQLDFKIPRKKAVVSKKFYRLYTKLIEALEEKNAEDIEEYAQAMQTYEIYSSNETYYRYSSLAEYFHYKGDFSQELNALNKAFRSIGSHNLFQRLKAFQAQQASDKLLVEGKLTGNKAQAQLDQKDEEKIRLLSTILHRKLLLELSLYKISDALHSTNKLLLITQEPERLKSYQEQKATLISAIESDQFIKTQAEINKYAYWRYPLLRHDFSFSDIKGQLTTLDVRCRNKRHIYTINTESKWSIPQSWQDCSVYVKGEQGSKFTFVEHPTSI